MSVNEKMTAIANKIRSLLGLSGKMGLDAMAANLDAEQANVAAAFAAIAEKGVSVPDGGTSGALAAAIAAIPSGGVTIKTGAFTVTTTDTAEVIEHGMGCIPGTIFVIKNESDISGSSSNYGFDDLLFSAKLNENEYVYTRKYVSRFGYYSSVSSTTRSYTYPDSVTHSKLTTVPTGSILTTSCINNVTETTFTTPSYMYGGEKYIWIAFSEAII